MNQKVIKSKREWFQFIRARFRGILLPFLKVRLVSWRMYIALLPHKMLHKE